VEYLTSSEWLCASVFMFTKLKLFPFVGQSEVRWVVLFARGPSFIEFMVVGEQ